MSMYFLATQTHISVIHNIRRGPNSLNIYSKIKNFQIFFLHAPLLIQSVLTRRSTPFWPKLRNLSLSFNT